MLAVLPIFLLGGLASLVRADLAFDEAQLGLVAGVFFASSAATAFLGGWLVERLGLAHAFRLGAAIALVSLAAIALLAATWWHLVGLMAIAGVVNSVMQPAANLAVARGVGAHRRGFALGVKQAAIPISTLLAGISVPVVGLTVGWRWAFAGTAALAVPFALAVPGSLPRAGSPCPPATTTPAGTLRAGEPEDGLPVERDEATATSSPTWAAPEGRRRRARGLLPTTIAIGGASAAANSLGSFYVESAVAAGQPIGRAGLLLSLGSVAGISVRLAGGALADRLRTDPFRLVSALLAVGAVGYLTLAHGGTTTSLVLATMVAFGAGWGWPGLFHLGVVRDHLDAPAAATGITQTGIFTGGFLGPIVFGWAVGTAGYTVAWSLMAASAATASTWLLLERLRASR